MKLREANWQLEQYEESAAPQGWICSWDRYGKIFLEELLPLKIYMDHASLNSTLYKLYGCIISTPLLVEFQMKQELWRIDLPQGL